MGQHNVFSHPKMIPLRQLGASAALLRGDELSSISVITHLSTEFDIHLGVDLDGSVSTMALYGLFHFSYFSYSHADF